MGRGDSLPASRQASYKGVCTVAIASPWIGVRIAENRSSLPFPNISDTVAVTQLSSKSVPTSTVIVLTRESWYYFQGMGGYGTAESSKWLDTRVSEYWNWIAVSLFLLTTVDMITTMYAVHLFGVVDEANPLIRWSLLEGPLIFASLNLLALVLVTVLFDQVMRMLAATPEPFDRYLAVLIEVWLGGLLAVGLLVFANNLMVIFFESSLI